MGHVLASSFRRLLKPDRSKKSAAFEKDKRGTALCSSITKGPCLQEEKNGAKKTEEPGRKGRGLSFVRCFVSF